MSDVEFISLITLIQHPKAFSGKRIRVVALAKLAFEAKSLWVTKEDLTNAITKNAIWLDVTLDKESIKLNYTTVIVEGTFNPDRMGHLGMYSGTIEKVTRMELWKPEK